MQKDKGGNSKKATRYILALTGYFLAIVLVAALIAQFTHHFNGIELVLGFGIVNSPLIIMFLIGGGIMLFADKDKFKNKTSNIGKNVNQTKSNIFEERRIFPRELTLEEQLAKLYNENKFTVLDTKLKERLPKSDLTTAIIEVAVQLGELKESLKHLQKRNLNQDVIFAFETDIKQASDTTWKIADRVAELKLVDLQPEGGFLFFAPPETPISKLVKKQTESFKQLAQAAKSARQSLLVILLSPNLTYADMITLETQLKVLSQAVEKLQNATGFENIQPF